ncbi:5-amino-6-(D-ribitylamino)uracil--L-tyrosine 4-hydroxyphenyl transferase CofH [Croceicoccus sp. F390]|uniref:FO synthase n=1 Tax=Croceicoccus esteveae TaxID=3075597 RepID=A0ABU2ZI75_9SPHN|nr:5-amino-6-(D-ribitylamino)uracil--L-tyrosine 4-hydroxyphenyl transferase CofH [Croceicoccus sp. F390]MDT0576313.1 5-amino-6-(D-ribitylamino)uracil--L-tyrosine 4-hydroxyphenyl transferase CofH [Croceicoccus sp. F390]
MVEWWNESEARNWLERLESLPLEDLLVEAEAKTMAAHGTLVTYSRKVFIPLTKLCRDVCHYCTFAHRPSQLDAPFLEPEEVLEIARAGEERGCRESLFTLGDRPEERYRTAREWLNERGFASTLDYLAHVSALVLKETSLLPHLNPGIMQAADYEKLRPVSASMGLMLESTSGRLCEKGMPHFGSPDKVPEVRLQSLRLAGEAKVPFTTGLLIGIGETRLERVEALLAIRDLHARYGHVQEVIIQNFRAKAETLMANAPDLGLDEHLWTIAAARLILQPEMFVQAPPNLQPGELGELVRAGVNDWGGVSPVTMDHVNPEAPWPHLEQLETQTEQAGRHLRQRLAVGPAFARTPDQWIDEALQPRVRRATDARGLPRDSDWHPGRGDAIPEAPLSIGTGSDMEIRIALGRVEQGEEISARQIARLFTAEGRDFERICRFADELRRDRVGNTITHVVNRNINYTNICLYRCGFCAFSKGSTKSERGPAYNIDHEEIARRTIEAHERGASEVCLQGGIHPSYDGNTYRGIVQAVKDAVPQMHVHAFSPLEVHHGATTLGLGYEEYLASLKECGLATLPGTAAEILSDDVREIICADKVNTDEWLAVMRAAHTVGLSTTATIMFGHVENYSHWATHLLRLRSLQLETGGFSEFVPLPFVHMEAPNWRRGHTRSGPTWRETVLMHAVSRIALDGAIPNIQVSWVKVGGEGAARILQAGANDLGGTLMDESITRAAGGVNGQEFGVPEMRALAHGIGRRLKERTTIYGRRLRETEDIH